MNAQSFKRALKRTAKLRTSGDERLRMVGSNLQDAARKRRIRSIEDENPELRNLGCTCAAMADIEILIAYEGISFL